VACVESYLTCLCACRGVGKQGINKPGAAMYCSWYNFNRNTLRTVVVFCKRIDQCCELVVGGMGLFFSVDLGGGCLYLLVAILYLFLC
jgi:hypothetical protein